MLKIYQEKAIVKNGANPAEVILDFKQGITLGKFVEYDRPTFLENYDRICRPGTVLRLNSISGMKYLKMTIRPE